MPQQIWGTFSVADHLRERPFVADVLLYDRLVIPVVPKNDESGRSRWHKQGWHPDLLDRIIETLANTNEELVWPVPWDLQQHKTFRTRFQAAQDVAFDAHNIATTREVDPDSPAFYVTRKILEAYASDPANRLVSDDLPADVWVDAMAAYPSYHAFAQEVSIDSSQKTVSNSVTTLAGVFGWEFVVPDEPKMTDLELLKSAAEFASDPKFKKKRHEFHEWRRKVTAEGITDEAAFVEMNRLVTEYGEVVRNIGIRTKVLNAFTIVGITASIASSFAVPDAGFAGAFITAARFGTEKFWTGREPTQEQQAAAMFHDARKWFGWQ